MKLLWETILSLILILVMEFSCHGQSEDTVSEKQRFRLEDNEIEMETRAQSSHVVKRRNIMGADSVLLQYYPNGQLYSQKPYKNGTINGIWYKYNSNGTLKSQNSYKDGVLQNDYCVEYDKFGFVRNLYLDIVCHKKKYMYSFISYYGEPYKLYVHKYTRTNRFKIVAEYLFDNTEKEWCFDYYHSHPSKLTSHVILQRFLKKDRQYHLMEMMQTTRLTKGVDYHYQN